MSGRSLAAIAGMSAALLAWPASAFAAQVSGDFNGDGRADLAVGVEGQTVSGHGQAGAIHVIYGSKHGLTGRGDRIFTQDTPGIKDSADDGERLGPVMAAGDFNGDGRADLAIGVPLESVGGMNSAGIVQVLYGSPHGLRVKGNQRFVEGSGGVPGSPASFAQFGYSLAAANFGHGKRDDLAIGAVEQTVGATGGAGAVCVLYGAHKGLSSKGSRLWSQDSPGIRDVAESADEFGWSLAAADLGRDRHADLAIGVVTESVGTSNSAGAVNVIYGSPKGLRSKGNQFLTQDSPGIKDAAEPGDELGWSVAAANLGRDRHADLAVGAPDESVGSASGAGAVNVIYGSPKGLRPAGNQFWSQDTPGVQDAAEPGDFFGWATAGGRFRGGRLSELAIGVPEEGVGSANGAGAVNVLRGSSHGLTANGNQFLTEGSGGLAGSPETFDGFGAGLSDRESSLTLD